MITNELLAVKWLAVKTASEMTYTLSGGALNSTQTKPKTELQPLEIAIKKAKFFSHKTNI